MAGSFKPTSTIQKSVQDKQAAEALQKLKGATAVPTQEEKKTQELQEKAKEVDSFLPKEVPTIYGILSYEDFKEKFKSVYDQVREKDHLVSGRITATFTIAGMSVTLRSLKVRERSALIPLIGDSRADLVLYSQNDGKYRLALMAIALTDLGGHTIPEIRLTPETLESWQTNPAIVQTMEFISDMDEAFVGMLHALYNDMSTAKQYALMENLKNQ